MAEKFDDGGFWLPSEFLTDDEVLTDFKTDSFKPKPGDALSYGFCSSFGFSSDLSSPEESVTGSTETESEENDFINFLTQKFPHSSLKDSKIFSDEPARGWKVCGSPQSTLYGYKPGSSRTNPKCTSEESSPPGIKDTIEWDLIYAAAEDIARMRATEEATQYYQTKVLSPSLKQGPATFTQTNPSAAFEFYSKSKTQAQHSQIQFRSTQMTGVTWGAGKIGSQIQNAERERTQALPSAAWPSLMQSQRQPQQMSSSGMRAVFLPENGAKKERTGTGVFLPRRYGVNYPETRKKTGCSSVLLPNRVVQALNINLDSIGLSTHALSNSNTNFTPEYEAALRNRTSNVMMAQKIRNFKHQAGFNQELCLPPEWTY